jgi:hypothetical protein
MAGYELKVVIIDAGDKTIKVGHVFWGVTEAEARTYYREHLSSCSYFAAAKRDGRVIEELFELLDGEELPTRTDPFPARFDEDCEDEFELEDEEEEYDG